MTTKKTPATLDPTLPFTEIVILGETYKACFRFREFAKADANLRRQGVASNMLQMMPYLTFETIPIVLAAALGTFHPDLSFEDVVALVDYDTIWDIGDELVLAWVAAFPDRAKKGDEENPPKPAQS